MTVTLHALVLLVGQTTYDQIRIIDTIKRLLGDIIFKIQHFNLHQANRWFQVNYHKNSLIIYMIFNPAYGDPN